MRIRPTNWRFRGPQDDLDDLDELSDEEEDYDVPAEA
jgi:hypothetical protein